MEHNVGVLASSDDGFAVAEVAVQDIEFSGRGVIVPPVPRV
jgi:hypothetical protein